MAGFFFGRVEEQRRLAVLVEEPGAVIYGLPGIGKSELAHQAVANLRATPSWEAVPVQRVLVEPRHAGVLHQYLLARLSGRGGELPELLAVLGRERHILILDDAHHASADVAALLDEISRDVHHASRVIVTSRATLPIITTPRVIRLSPLTPSESRELADHFASRLGVRADGLDSLIEQSGGSPFLLRHLIAGSRRGHQHGDPVQEAIALLDAEARVALIRLAAVAGCSRSRLVAARLVPDDRVFNTLAEQFLVDPTPEELIVHELVREVAMTHAEGDMVSSSRRTAAQVLWEDYERHHVPLVAIESICLSVSAGDVEQAFASLRRAIRSVSDAGLDHLLVPPLEHLGAEHHPEAKLALARIYLRMARIADAARTVDALPPSFDRNLSALVTRATIAERRCQIGKAKALLGSALEVTADPRTRCLLSMRLAILDAMTGNDEAAGSRMAEIENDPAVELDVDRVRRAWMRGIVHALQLEWDECIAVVTEGRRLAQRAALADLDFLLLMLELLAASELGNITRADELAGEARSAIPNARMRERMSELYVGVAHLVCGRVDEAVATLERAFVEYERQEDESLACLAGHFLGRALALHGELARSIDVLSEVSERAIAAGMRALVGPGQAHLCRSLLTIGRVADADRISRELLDHPNLALRAEAHALRGYVHAFRGELEQARTHAARALELTGHREPSRTNHALDQAFVELFGGDPERARTIAVAILENTGRWERPYTLGRGLLITAVADVAAGIYDGALMSLARVEELATNHGLHFLRPHVALLRAATSHQGASILERVPVEQQQGYIGILRVLGLRPGTVIVSSQRGLMHTEQGKLSELARHHDLLIDLTSGAIVERSGQSIEGRGIAATIVAALSEATEPVTPEQLYRIVWGGAEYHPLRHRNTLYIALNRTRKLLEELIGSREVIVRCDPGWLIELDVAVARRDPRVSTVAQRP